MHVFEHKILSNIIFRYSQVNEQLVVRKYIDGNEHERLFCSTLIQKLK